MTPGARSERRWRPRGKEDGVDRTFNCLFLGATHGNDSSEWLLRPRDSDQTVRLGIVYCQMISAALAEM